MAFTVTPWGAHSTASVRVSWTTPPLLAQYATLICSPTSPPIEAMLAGHPLSVRPVSSIAARGEPSSASPRGRKNPSSARLVRALSDEQTEIMRDPRRAPQAKLPRIEDAIAAGGVLCGSPEQIIGHLKSLEKRYPGLDRVSVSLSVGVPKAVALEQLERFGKEVMPAFAQAKTPELVPAQ